MLRGKRLLVSEQATHDILQKEKMVWDQAASRKAEPQTRNLSRGFRYLSDSHSSDECVQSPPRLMAV